MRKHSSTPLPGWGRSLLLAALLAGCGAPEGPLGRESAAVGGGATGSRCTSGADCASGACTAGYCRTPSCSDHVKNGAETDVDCGGGLCHPCADSLVCAAGRDCASGVCLGMACAVPSCADGVKNGVEVDVDCGGMCGPCHDGQKCNVAADCRTGDDCFASNPAVNPQRYCRQPSICTNKRLDSSGGETGVDCGGPCKPCPLGQGCLVNADCTSKVCAGNVCATVANGSSACADPSSGSRFRLCGKLTTIPGPSESPTWVVRGTVDSRTGRAAGQNLVVQGGTFHASH